MIKGYLDENIYNLIVQNFNFNNITEIRLRLNKRIVVAIKNKKFYLKDKDEYVLATQSLIDDFVKRISQNSLYAFNDNIINGFVTLKNGVRVGLAGTVVYDGEKVVTIKDFQAINIRIPHFIKNCSLQAYNFLVDGEVENVLIISPPGAGKTTFLRDLIFQFNTHELNKNILIVDERGEICCDGNFSPNLSDFCDVYTNCKKEFAFKNGIRSMAPNVIVTDELDLTKDLPSIKEAANCGVKIVATIHADNLTQLKRKCGFEKLLEEKIFTRFVVLSLDNGPGTLKYIYDENLNCIHCGDL